MSTFPSIISTISNPQPTDKLSSPSHSSIESAQNDAISKLENFIGTLSSIQGTLMYDIRAGASNGGGHVQSANKGGTGQTGFNKGDIIVATSSSVLSKLAVGSDGQALVADSAQAPGVKWGGVATATQIQNQTYIYGRASVISNSVYGVVLQQAVSVLTDGLGLVVKFPKSNPSSVVALQVNATGPSSLTALIKNTRLGNLQVGDIQASMIGILEFDSVSSVFQMVTRNPLTSVNVSAQYTGDTASGTQTVAHGLSRMPSKVRVTATKSINTGLASMTMSWGSYDGITNTFTSVSFGATFSFNDWDGGTDNFAVVINDSGAVSQKGKVSFDATNIYIAWTKQGTPNNNLIYLLLEVE